MLESFYRRNAERLSWPPGTLFINAPCAWGCEQAKSGYQFFTQDYCDYKTLRDAGLMVEFGCFPAHGPAQFHDVVIAAPREKSHLEQWLHWASTIGPETRVWLAGENRAGIKSAARRIRTFFSEVGQADAARHCVMWRAQAPMPGPEFDVRKIFSKWSVQWHPQNLEVVSAPGVFSHGRLDPATAMLLEVLNKLPLRGDILDFGCGSGVLGLGIKSTHPEVDLHCADVSALALESCRQSLSLNGHSANVMASCGFKDIEFRFDMIVSNPPFHRGVVTQSDMSMKMLGELGINCKAGGQLVIVANRHLAYPEWMDKTFGGHEVLKSNNKYAVYRGIPRHGERGVKPT